MALPITLIDPAKEFSGGDNLTPDPDANPELGDLIYQLQNELNTLGATGFNPTVMTETGDIIYASAPATVAALHHGTAGDVLRSGGHGAAPAYGSQILGSVKALAAALDMKTDETEVSGALNGDATKHWMPTHVLLIVAATTGALNSDGTINVGTSAGGTEIKSAIATTGLTAVGNMRMVPVAEMSAALHGGDTIYANVETPETGAGTLSIDVYVLGVQV